MGIIYMYIYTVRNGEKSDLTSYMCPARGKLGKRKYTRESRTVARWRFSVDVDRVRGRQEFIGLPHRSKGCDVKGVGSDVRDTWPGENGVEG